MANVLDILKPLAQPSLNGFDLSQKHVYGSAPARLDTPLFVETMPKDKFQIDLAGLMRTMTLNTPAFLRGKVTYDFYFVPYSQIWHPFNQFIDQRKDAHSTRQRGFKYVPVISLYDLFRLISSIHVAYYDTQSGKYDGLPYYLKDIHGIPWVKNIFHLLDFFGYGNFIHLQKLLEIDDVQGFDMAIELYRDKYVNIFRPAAYQHIWYDAYRNKFYDNYEWDNQVYGHVEDFVGFFNFDDIQCDTFANSIIPIDLTDISANQRIYGIFQQRYVQFKQDFIQSALPSQQFGAVSDVQIDIDVTARFYSTALISGETGNDMSRWVQSDESPLPSDTNVVTNTAAKVLKTPAGNIIHNHAINGVATINQPGTASGSASLDVLALKRAEALQKWRQNTMRAGNMVDDNFRAHFGATPRYESDNNVFKIASFDAPLNINAVETTSQSSGGGNNRVGDLGASATSVTNGNQFNFDCSDFGVIVCAQYFRVESEYASSMMDRANTLFEPFDFPSPEFCNIGLSPIELRDYNFNLNGASTILGFASQYWWYKCALDKSHGEFAKYQYLDLGHGTDVYLEKGSMNFWNAPRILDMVLQRDGTYFRSKSSLYQSPSILDDVFGVAYYSDDVSLALANPLTFNTFYSVKVLRPLTVVGLPQF